MTTWDDGPGTDWNDGEPPAISWADDANEDEAAQHERALKSSSYETPEPPSEPAVDENGRTIGVVKVSLQEIFPFIMFRTTISSYAKFEQSWRADKAFGFIGRDDGQSEFVSSPSDKI